MIDCRLSAFGFFASEEVKQAGVNFAIQLRREFGAGTPLSLSVMEPRFHRLPGYTICDKDDYMGLDEKWWDGAAKGWRTI